MYIDSKGRRYATEGERSIRENLYNDLIFPDEIARARERITIGEQVRIVNRDRRDPQVVIRSVKGVVGRIILLSGSDCLTCTIKEYAKYLRDKSVPIGNGFKNYSGREYKRYRSKEHQRES